LQLSEALVGYTALERERDMLKRQLQREADEKDDLDCRLKGLLEETRDDAAQETVAAYEVKYNRCKESYKVARMPPSLQQHIHTSCAIWPTRYSLPVTGGSFGAAADSSSVGHCPLVNERRRRDTGGHHAAILFTGRNAFTSSVRLVKS
jgi:hypothetical protein